MPANLDFCCPKDGCEVKVISRIAPSGSPPPVCPAHELPMVVLWVGRGYGMDAIEAIEYEHDDGRRETITSLSRAREIERQAERDTAAGIGRPVVFRHLSQDLSSHRDVNVFQDRHPQVAREKMLRMRRGKPIISVGGVDITVHGSPGDSGEGDD